MPIQTKEYMTADSTANMTAAIQYPIAQFQCIKIQPNTIDLSTRLWGINSTNCVVIPRSLILRSIVLG